MKRFLIFFGISLLIHTLCSEGVSQVENKITKVVLDAGHGGKDPGAVGKKSKEKDIVLDIALRAGKYINENLEDVEVIYTRKTDEFIELRKRAQIANEAGADVFISIHCNANQSSRPYGSETYVMGLHKTLDNLDVAKTENAAIYYEDDYKTQYEGFNPDADEDYIVLSMFQSSSIEQSIDLSSKVQYQFRERVGRKDRGVKQAGFWVLYKTTMPGILIELGFISNSVEEKFLLSEDGKVYMASAIYRAFKEYKQQYEEINKDLKPVIVKKEEPKPQVFYRIQFASYKKEKSLDFKKFRGLKNVKMYEHNGQFKYTAGNEDSLEKAQALKEELVENGYEDVFIVAFVNDERIPLDEAKQLSENQN